MTDAQKLARIEQIIRDQQALEEHQSKSNGAAGDIQFGRADAYRYIVEVMTGKKPR